MIKALLIGSRTHLYEVYGIRQIERLRSMVEVVDIIETDGGDLTGGAAALDEVEVIFSTWGMSRCDEEFLARIPKLRAIFYAAGSTKSWLTNDIWDRGIRIFTAAYANAYPVAEYCLAATIFGLKRILPLSNDVRKGAHWHSGRLTVTGSYGATVGLISLSRTGRLFSKLARNLDVKLLAYDPVIDPLMAQKYVDEHVSLTDILERSNVVSVHAPSLPETHGLISGAMIEAMKPHSVFINTSRGNIVREAELVEALKRRPDIFAYLDVTDPEPPSRHHPLYQLPNVLLTPHLAGSLGNEQERLASSIIDEFERFVRKEVLEHELCESDFLQAA